MYNFNKLILKEFKVITLQYLWKYSTKNEHEINLKLAISQTVMFLVK